MDPEGHICLTDFGLAKEVPTDEETQTFCGTPEYLGTHLYRGLKICIRFLMIESFILVSYSASWRVPHVWERGWWVGGGAKQLGFQKSGGGGGELFVIQRGWI